MKSSNEFVMAINKYKQSLKEAKMPDKIKIMTRVEVFLCPQCEGTKGKEEYIGRDECRVYRQCEACVGSGISFVTQLQREKEYIDSLPKEGDWVRCDIHGGYFKVARRDGLFLLMKNKFALSVTNCVKIEDQDLINALERGLG